MKDKKKNGAGEGLKRPLRADFRTTNDEYELMMRETYESSHVSYNEWICARLFQHLQERLSCLRKLHRAQRIPDSKFYHPTIKKRMGIKTKTGRHRIQDFVAA